VSIPEGTDKTTYVVDWELIGDYDPGYYTTVSKSEFTVIAGTDTPVTVGAINPVVIGAKSQPIKLSVEYAPDQDITVGLTLTTAKTVPQLTLSTSSVTFKEGITEQYFTIYCASGVDITTYPSSSI
jgi:hypothetical protein